MQIGGYDIIEQDSWTRDNAMYFFDELRLMWPSLVIEEEGSEFFAYRNAEAKESWEGDEPDQEAMVHLLLGPETTTFVVGSKHGIAGVFVRVFLHPGEFTVPGPGWWWVRSGARLLGTAQIYKKGGQLYFSLGTRHGVPMSAMPCDWDIVGRAEVPPLEVPEARKIQMITGDITQMPEVDAIVNAANENLKGGSGVCGAIFKAAGWEAMQASCNEYPDTHRPRCPTGEAVVTEAHALPNKGVIHAVGPIYDPEKPRASQDDLFSAYYSAIKLADEYGYKSIAFPAISCGIFKFPVEEAARIAMEGVVEGLVKYPSIEKVVFVFLPFGDGPEVQAEFEMAWEAIQ